jgi:fatty acid amide hydrolase
MSELWELPATELAARIARGDVSSVETVGAHIDRIEAVNGTLRAVVLRRFHEALDDARAADRRRAAGEPLGPLHGVPVTIKDELDVAGLPSTFGIPSRLGDRAPGDDPHVARWRAAGAIVIGKTNVPQLMLYIESDNPLFGRTNNPWDLARTCGGSSGGEAAIIAAGGSPLGLGSDIGGSLRVPAAFCGIVSLKPTSGRLDNAVRLSIFQGQRAIVSQEGPLARTVADVALGLEVANGGRAPDVLPPRPLGDPALVDVRGLRVGYYESAGSFVPSPAISRAVREAATVFEQLGAHVVPFDPPNLDDALDLFLGILSADRAAGAIEVLGKDKRDPRLNELFTIASRSRRSLRIVDAVLALAGERTLRRYVRNYGYDKTAHFYKLVEGQLAYRKIFAHALDAAPGGPLDLIICPPTGLPALPHGQSANVVAAGPYAPVYNVLGYPTGTQPFTRVRAGEEMGRRKSRDRVERGAYETERGSAGLPVGVQLVARPWREDVALAAMAALETAARTREDFPHTPVTPAT